MWYNVLFALEDGHIIKNTHLAHVFPNIKKTGQYVISKRHQSGPAEHLYEEQPVYFFALSAIQQIDYFVPGTIRISTHWTADL
jgi:hypothetical protein